MKEHTDFPASGQNDIFLQDVTVRYDDSVILDDLCLTFEQGRIHAVMGQSGVGKSTLLRFLAGLPDITASGRAVMPDGTTVAAHCTMMFQEDNLLPWASILDNVTIGFRLRGEAPDIAKAHAYLELVGLSDHLGKYPHQLSGGMRQRVALVRTLLEDRPVILMDEPFSALDALTRMQLQDQAVSLFEGKTVILVTHDPIEALRIADTLTILKPDGAERFVQHKALRELLGPAPVHPASPALASKLNQILTDLGLYGETMS